MAVLSDRKKEYESLCLDPDMELTCAYLPSFIIGHATCVGCEEVMNNGPFVTIPWNKCINESRLRFEHISGSDENFACGLLQFNDQDSGIHPQPVPSF